MTPNNADSRNFSMKLGVSQIETIVNQTEHSVL